MTEQGARTSPDLATDRETTADTHVGTVSPTETHQEPHGSASPHGPADDVRHAPDDGAGHAEHENHGEALGPVDVRAWAAGAVGVLLGLVVVACLVVATGGFGS